MFDLLTRYWWVLVLRGVIAILLGLMAFARPGLTLAAFIIWFGAYALVDGALEIYQALAGRRRQDDDWWIVLLTGVAGVLVGIVTFRAPAITAVGLLLYVAAWALAKGVLEVVAAIRLRSVIQGEIWLGLAGVASIAFAVLLMMYPLAGILGLLWVVAAYGIVFGVMMVALGFRVRARRTHVGAAFAKA
jgi:uncharacterized membrane protein HdeD (DUF308 family)